MTTTLPHLRPRLRRPNGQVTLLSNVKRRVSNQFPTAAMPTPALPPKTPLLGPPNKAVEEEDDEEPGSPVLCPRPGLGPLEVSATQHRLGMLPSSSSSSQASTSSVKRADLPPTRAIVNQPTPTRTPAATPQPAPLQPPQRPTSPIARNPEPIFIPSSPLEPDHKVPQPQRRPSDEDDDDDLMMVEKRTFLLLIHLLNHPQKNQQPLRRLLQCPQSRPT